MADFYTALRDGVRDSVCSFLQDASNWRRTFSKLGPFDTPVGVLPDTPAIAYGLFCNRPPQPPETDAAPFDNGQCAGTVYQVTYTATGNVQPPTGPSYSETRSTFGNFVGPIVPLGYGTNASGDPNNPLNAIFNFTFGTPPQASFIAAGLFCTEVTGNSAAVTPVNGPDDCGGPPTTPIPPPAPNSNVFTPPITFNDDNGVEVRVEPTIIIGVGFLNAKAEINIPIDVKVGPVTLQANLNLTTGDINFGPSFSTNITGGGGSPAKPCECIPPTGSDDDPPTRPPGVPSPPSPPEDPTQGERRIVGAIVTVSNDAGQDSIDNSLYSAPNVGVPYYGLCFFIHKTDNGLLSWSQDFPVKVRQQYIPCPFPDGAVSVVAVPRYPQQSILATPVYREDSTIRETEPIS